MTRPAESRRLSRVAILASNANETSMMSKFEDVAQTVRSRGFSAPPEGRIRGAAAGASPTCTMRNEAVGYVPGVRQADRGALR